MSTTRSAGRRRTAPPQLALVRGAATAVEAPTEAPQDNECYVIENKALGEITRLVLLAGDPHAPFAGRAGAATVEIRRGYAPSEDEESLIQDVITLLKAHGRKQWEREQRVQRWMRRAHLELTS